MRQHESGDEFSDEAAEQLIDDIVGGRPGRPDPLTEVLRAAAAPADPAELAGLDAATAAFRAATARPGPPAPWFTPRRLTTLRAASFAAALAVGCAAIAFTAGVLPEPLAPAPSMSVSAEVASESPGPHPTRTPHQPSPSPSPVAGQGSQAPSAVSVRKLCRTYLKDLEKGRHLAEAQPGFPALVGTAGGLGQVAAYCGRLLGIGSPARKPSPGTGAPAGHHHRPPPAKTGTAPLENPAR